MSRRSSRRGRGGGPTVSGEVLGRNGIPADPTNLRLLRTGENIQIGDIDADEARDEITATFRLKDPKDGERKTFRVNPELTELVIIDLLEEADKIASDSPKALIMAKTYLFEHVHPDDRADVWRICRAKRLDMVGVMTLANNILAGVAANPTGERSGSSDGRPATSTYSPPGSSTPAAAPSAPPSDRAAAFRHHIDRIQNRTGEDGKVLPINAAIAAQLVVAARSQGIPESELSSQSAAATG